MRGGGVRKPRGGYGRALGAPHGDGGYTWAGIVRTSAVPGAGCWEDVMIVVEVVPPSPRLVQQLCVGVGERLVRWWHPLKHGVGRMIDECGE